MTPSQKQAIITLVEKPGKDNTLMKSSRPISLLNVDFKILSKIMANKTRQDKTMFILLLKMSIRIQIQSAKTKKQTITKGKQIK